MRLTLAALLALPVALRVACLEPVPLNTNLQAEVDDVCPDYTNYAKVKQ
jgi:hypothetical protein